MQSRFIVKIRPRQPAAHHRPGLAGERGAQCPDVAPILAHPELHNQPASGGELRSYLVSKYECLGVSVRHINSKTYMTTYYSQHPSLHLKGDWLAEAGFETGRGVTVKISQGCIVLMADNNEVQELREQLYQAKQVVKGMKDVLV